MGARKNEGARWPDDDEFLPPYLAARMLVLSPSRVRQLIDRKQLAALRMPDGRRIIRRSDVERLMRERETRRQVV